MRQVLKWTLMVVLCCGASVAASEAPMDARLQEARAALDEATKLAKEGEYAEAISQGEQALALREAVLGNTHLEVAATLNLLGDLYLRQGHHARAEPLLQRALAIREAALGKLHPEVASSLGILASLYVEQGLYEQAEPLLQRALAIREAALGEHHPDIADSLNSLAILYSQKGLYAQAEPLFQRALAIREAVFGKDHPNVAPSLNNLANLYREQGLYAQAEPLFQRALAIREAVFGKNHPSFATSLNNLANVYFDQGLYGKAEPLFRRALAIREEALGKQHPLVADTLSNLAILYSNQSLLRQAEPLLRRALAIREAAFGKQHPLIGHSLNSLAELYRVQGLYGRAEPLLRRALEIQEAALGTRHPDVSFALGSLARVYRDQGLYGRAEPLYQRMLAIWEEALGPQHPAVAEALNDLARLHLAQHRLAQALPLLTRAFTISEQRLRMEALDFSEARMADFLRALRMEEALLYALLRAHPGNTAVQRLALSSLLLRKGRSVEEASNTYRAIWRSLGPEDRDAFERLRELRSQLAQLSLQGSSAPSSAGDQPRLKELAEQGDALEAELAKRSAPLRARSALPSPEEIVDRVAAALPKDGALVEFVAYEARPLVPKPGTPVSKLPSQARYLALVLFPDASIRAIDMGPAAAINQAATSLRDALAARDVAFQGPAQALYALVFKPLLPALGTTRRLWVAPDGQLGLVPFAALHDGKSFLIDSFDISYVTSGKDLLARPEGLSSPDSVVVLADPDCVFSG